MKSWKWKTLLAVFCATFATAGLVACKSKAKGDDLTNITWSGSSYTYTDSNTWNDILSDLSSKTKLSGRTTEGETITINGTDCDFTSTIEFDGEGHCEIGSYTITVKPKANNPKNYSRSKTVEITHDFAATSDTSRDICEYCAATRTRSTENTVIHYGGFHNGTGASLPEKKYEETAVYTNKITAGTSYIKEFGTATVNGQTVTVPTLTVGQLEPGMTITVKGTAQTSWETWGVAENAYYYFPVIGFADRSLNDPEWEGTKTDTETYSGGTSIFVRGEGWVLYNGIGNIGTSELRALGALSSYASGGVMDGKGEARNYGSHEAATLGTSEVRPTSFTPGQVPSVENWENWVVYSKGTTSNSGDNYVDETEIELVWNYRQDGVIELTYDAGGRKLVCMVKVPDSSLGYYDTILHGDYVDMNITSYEIIETRTPKDFDVDDKEVTMFEGQEFDLSAFSATFTYEQTGNEKYPQSLTLANIYATTAENVDAEGEIVGAGEWVSMADHPVTAAYKHYKVQVTKSNKVFFKTFAVAGGKIHVVHNLIESVNGGDAGSFYNYNTVGGFTLGTSAGNITLTPNGDIYAQAIASDLASSFSGSVTGRKFIALNIKAREGETLGDITEVTSGSAVPYSYNKANGTLVLALSANDKSVTVKGLNSNDTVLDLSGVLGFNVSTTLTVDKTGTGWYLNNASNTAKLTAKAEEGKSLTNITIGGTRIAPNGWLTSAGSTTYTTGSGVKVSNVTYTDDLFTADIEYPAANLANYATHDIIIYSGLVDMTYKLDYVPQLDTNEGNDTVDSGYYTFVTGNKIYLAKVLGSDEENTALALNVNDGGAAEVLSLNYNYKKGAASFVKKLNGAAINTVTIAGTDILLIEVDPAQYGVSTNSPYGYQIKTANYSTSYYAVVNNAAHKTTVGSGSLVIVNDGSCLEAGLSGTLTATEVGETEVEFIATPTEFGGDHHFSKIESGQVCAYCGETLDRNKQWSNKAYNLHENEYVEMWGTYATVNTAQVSGNWPLWLGVKTYVAYGGNNYRVRNDGWVALGDTNDPADETDITFGSITPNGQYDGDGNVITEETFIKAMVGADFRIWAGYQDGVLTLKYSFYKSGKLYYQFTHVFKNLTAEVAVSFAKDGGASIVINGSGNEDANFVTGKIDKSMIDNVTDSTESVVLTVGNIENHLATVTATSGNATAITEGVKTKLGIASDDESYAKYVSFEIDLSEAYTTGVAAANVYTDAAYTKLHPAAKAEFNSDKTKLIVTIALGEGDKAPGVYYLDLKNNTGSTKQVDIKLDLSAVSMKNTKGTIYTEGSTAKLVSGGSLVIKYTGINDLSAIANAKISVNGVERALGTTIDFGNDLTAAWSHTEGSNEATLALQIPKQVKFTEVPVYTVKLLDGDTTAATNVYTLTALPTAGGSLFEKEANSIYGYVEGNKLYLYLFGDAATGTDYLVFNANNASTNKDLILPYSLAYSVSGSSVLLKNANTFTSASHCESGAFKATLFEISLDYFGIGASAAFYFDVLTADIGTTAEYYAVSTAHAVDKQSVTTLPAKSPIDANGCTKVGSEGYAITEGQDVVGYYGISTLPSHTWIASSADATLFECSVCGAVLKNNTATNQLIPADYFGDGKIDPATGMTVSFFLVSATGGDWGSVGINTVFGNVRITLPNLQCNIMTDVSSDAAIQTLKEKLPDNSFPSVGATVESGYTFDSIINSTNSYVTISLNTESGVTFYLNGSKVMNYAPTCAFYAGDGNGRDFVEIFLLCAAHDGIRVGSAGVTVQDALIQKGVLTDAQVTERYNLYLQEKAALAKLVAHVHAYTNSDHTCSCGALDPAYDFPTYSALEAFTVGTDGTQNGTAWTKYTVVSGNVFAVEKGKKLTFTGTSKANNGSSNAAADQNYYTPTVALYSGKQWAAGAFRGDDYVVDGDTLKANEGWAISSSNTSSSNWTTFKQIIYDCSLVIEVDWTNESQIVIREIYTKTGDTNTTATQTYTITSTGTFNEQYSVEIGVDNCYYNVTSVTKV